MKKGIFAACAVVAFALPAIAGSVKSGLEVGEMVTPFHPTHVSGPDKGTDTCPPCKYGALPAVQVWVNNDDEANVMAIAKSLSSEVKASKADLKAFVIKLSNCDACVTATKEMAGKASLDNIAMAYLPSKDKAIQNYKVNTDASVKNTVFVYRDRKVVAKFVNLKADKAGLGELHAAIAKASK